MSKNKRTPSTILNKYGVKVPVFIMLKDTTMRYRKVKDDYYRDGGDWSTDYIIKDGKLFSDISLVEHINNVELIKITKKEWVKGNGRYTPNDSIIKRDLNL